MTEFCISSKIVLLYALAIYNLSIINQKFTSKLGLKNGLFYSRDLLNILNPIFKKKIITTSWEKQKLK